MKIGKTKIEFNTFFKRGVPRIDDSYGLYIITGKQGTGKTYEAVRLARKNYHKIKKIKTNIRSLGKQNNLEISKISDLVFKIYFNSFKVPIEYFTKINEIYFDDEEYVMYIIDEISRKYKKNSDCDMHFYAWLNQCRKTHRMCILITQEYKELPMWLRRPIKYQLCTKPTPILNWFGIFTTFVGYGENPILDKDTLEWECPILYRIIHKRNMEVAELYDTFEPIANL